MAVGYLGRDNKARKINKAYVGVNGKARLIKQICVGENGIARLAYPLPVTIPSVTGNYTYNRTNQSAVISEFDKNVIDVYGTLNAVDANTYRVIFRLKYPYSKWADGSTGDIVKEWKINPKSVNVPTVTGNYTYNGTERRPVVSSYDTNEIKLSGETKGTNAKTYTLKLVLTSTQNYRWNDSTGGTGQRDKLWAINPKVVAVPTVTGNFTYSGSIFSASIGAYNQNEVSVNSKSVKSATNAGTYYIYFDLKSTVNYRWSGTNDTAQKKGSWVINKKELAVPYQSRNFYWCRNVTFEYLAEDDEWISNFNPTLMKTDKVVRSNVGTYSDYVYLKDSTNYKFVGTTATKVAVSWSIKKATLTVDGQSHYDVNYTAAWTSEQNFSNNNGMICDINKINPSITKTDPNNAITILSTGKDTLYDAYEIRFAADGRVRKGDATIHLSLAGTSNFNATSKNITFHVY